MSLNTQHNIKINLNFGELKPMLKWCENNCIGKWQYMEDPYGSLWNSWVFFFEEERDYVAFILWNK